MLLECEKGKSPFHSILNMKIAHDRTFGGVKGFWMILLLSQIIFKTNHSKGLFQFHHRCLSLFTVFKNHLETRPKTFSMYCDFECMEKFLIIVSQTICSEGLEIFWKDAAWVFVSIKLQTIALEYPKLLKLKILKYWGKFSSGRRRFLSISTKIIFRYPYITLHVKYFTLQ